MDLNQVNAILNNKTKHDIFYNERPIWIQEIDSSSNFAKVGFVDTFEEEHVKISDLYEKDLFNN